MLGAAIAFGISRHFRDSLLQRLPAPWARAIAKWRSRLRVRSEFWGWVALRLPTNAGFDYISYAAGLTQCTWSTFLLSTFVGSLPTVALFFYLGGKALGSATLVNGLLILLALGIAGTIISRRVDAKHNREDGTKE